MTKKEYIEKYGEEAYRKHLEYYKQYYQQHREEKKQYREQHKEQKKQYLKQYYQEHKEEIKRYYQQHKEEMEQYYQEHKEERKQYQRKHNQMFAYCIPEEWEQIENYELAKKDSFKGWHIHHRLETHNSDGEKRLVNISRAELIALDMYYNRPANELIFLTKSEHTSLHNRNRKKQS